MSSSTSNTIINPKDCSYQCGTRIYWNTSENAYFEVFSKKKHVCPNRSNKTTTTNNNNSSNASINRQSYYNKKPWVNNKPKMSNSLELLQGPIQDIQKKYEILSDIVSEYNGKVHGSQRDRDPRTGEIDLLVYYEVPEGKREEVKRKFENFTKNNTITLQQRNK